MDLQLTEEHKMIRDMAREFAQKEIAPVAAHFDETGEFPYETVKKMSAQGFMGIEVPEEYGGQGLDTISYVLAMIEIAKAEVSHSTIVSVHNSLYAHGLLKFGTEEQQQNFLTPVAAGQ
jgi:alkylation response protein AidB-like acyl-CoA dehydrogenase